MVDARTNDTLDLTPLTNFGGRSLSFEFPGLRIGVAEYEEGPTGCTVFHFPKGAALSIDVRGGSVGLAGGDYAWTHAICLAGGSLYGLEATAGVAAELFAMRDYSVAFTNFALVSGAIIYDYGRRQNTIYPDKALGRAALRIAREGWFPLGKHGAGRAATVGKLDFSGHYQGEWGGQGGAFGEIGAIKFAVFTVVNSVGAIINRDGNVVRGCLDPSSGARVHPATILDAWTHQQSGPLAVQNDEGRGPTPNTTLTVLVTNLRLGSHHLRQLGRQVHTSMARGIQPFQTDSDGDVLFTVSTNEVELAHANQTLLAYRASELAWDAILASF